MRVWGSSLLAVLPFLPPADLTPQAAPCGVAIELEVKAPLQWGALEWRLLTREVEGLWERYGLSLCWGEGTKGCVGWQVRLRVLVAEDLPPSGEITVGAKPIVGRIIFDADGPGTDIALSVRTARALAARARLGGRPLGGWPTTTVEHFVPRVVGRALAHEVGHYVLGSRSHTRTGLMAGSFRPDDVTLGEASRFRLSEAEATAVRVQCLAGGVKARAERREVALSVQH
jgi:hypothetical protein